MNWYQKQKESASLLHVSPRYRGKDSGTAGAKPMDIVENERLFPTEGVMQSVPDGWDKLDRGDRVEYVNTQVKQGKLRFPSTVEKWIADDFAKYPYDYLQSIALCLHKTNKMPNFSREWIEINWAKNNLPQQLKAIMDGALRAFPEDRKKPFMLFEEHTETLLDNPQPKAAPQPKAKPLVPNKLKPRQPQPQEEFEEIWDWKTDKFVKVPIKQVA